MATNREGRASAPSRSRLQREIKGRRSCVLAKVEIERAAAKSCIQAELNGDMGGRLRADCEDLTSPVRVNVDETILHELHAIREE